MPDATTRTIAAALLPLLLVACQQEREDRVQVAGGDAERGRALTQQYGCGGCHVIPGLDGAVGLAGPPLTAWPDRSYIAGALPNEPEHLVRWIHDPQSIEPGTAMPTMAITLEEARHIAAYLYTIPGHEIGPPHLLPKAILERLKSH